jgi:two-component system, OmpR family, response regulator CpxR
MILVIDDDIELCALIQRFLAGEGFETECAHSGVEGVRQALRGRHALILLDVMLPDISGFEALRRLRAESRTPVLMLTARGDTLDRVLGLEMGADDYLPKPFDPPELAARIRAILRRVNSPPVAGPARLTLADLEVDFGSRTVRREGRLLDLTTVEFDLLAALMRSAGAAVSREHLAREVLGREFSPFDRSIDTHICNLRKKLGALADGGERIKSIRGAGYLYAASMNAAIPR